MALLIAALGLILLVGCAPADPPVAPSEVTYMLGGIMSGPYKVTADLGTGIVVKDAEVAKYPPPGEIPKKTEPVKGQIPNAELAYIRQLAARIWTVGAQTERCLPQADAIGSLDIRRDVPGKTSLTFETRTYVFSTTCETDETEQLLTAVTCPVEPRQSGCK